MLTNSSEVTTLLAQWSDGDPEALDRLAPLVFNELRGLARAHFQGERIDHTLQPTALVNEVFVRLLGRRKVLWHNRGQFFQCAIEMMRRILVDHARRNRAAKRGGDAVKVPLEGLIIPDRMAGGTDALALQEALDDLGRKDPNCRRIVELKYYFGMTHEEIGAVVNLAPSTVKQKWAAARVRLYHRLKKT